MNQPLRVLMIEDSPDDADLVLNELRRGGLEATARRVDSEESMRSALAQSTWDVLLSEHLLPDFSAQAALTVLKELELDLPLIIVSRAIRQQQAAEAVRAGCRDCVSKSTLTRLAPAVEREIGATQVRRARQQAEAALQESERRYRRMLAAVTSYRYTVWVEDGVATSTEHGPGCLAVTGYTPEDYAADPTLWLTMIHRDDRDAVLAHVDGILQGPARPPIEHRIIHRDGTTRWVRDTIVPHHDQGGGLSAYDGLVEDITERKRAEETLRGSEAPPPPDHASRAIKDLKPGDHLCCIYETDEEHRAVLTPFLRQGSEGGEKVVYITDAHTAETVLGYLRDDGLDVEPYLDRGQLVILARDDAYMRGGVFDPDRMIALLRSQTERALAGGYSALRVTGEMTWALGGLPGSERLIEYEAKLNNFFPGSKCLAICQYDRRRFEPAVLLDVLRTHPIAVIGTKTYDNFHYVPAAELLSADVPATTLRHWVESLNARERAQQALRDSEERYRALFEQAAESVVLVDGETGALIEFNDRAHENLGYTRDEFRNLKIADFEVLESPEEVAKHTARIISEAADTFETRHRTKDGQIRDILVNSRGLSIAGKDFACSLWRDVTERKRAEEALRESEEKYRHLFEQLNDAAFLADTETGVILDANAQAEALLGRTRDEIIGMHQSELHPPDKSEEYRQKFARHVAMERAADYDGEVIRKDGSVVPVTIGAVTLTLTGRQLILGLFRDITERRQFEEQLRQAQKMEAVGTLASGVAHDFNNLLTAIFGYTELAKKTLDKQDPAVQLLEMIEQAGEQASAVTKALLTVGRKVTAEKRPVDLGRAVSESIRLLRSVLPASIEVTEQVTDDPNTWVKADETQLQQVLMNLAVNARDAMPDGGQLRISLQPAAVSAKGEAKPAPQEAVGSERGGVMLVVEDTGTGMSPEVRQRVFEPFFTTKPRGQGTGLGMSVIHGIVTDHGGEIRLDSTPGAGTRVAIHLPRCDPDQATAAASPTEARKPGRGELILVVDDDEHVRSIVTSVLRSQGYEVVQAGDGEEAMAVLDGCQRALHLVLLDLDLPRRSGLSCLEEIRRTKGQIPVILMTGQVDVDPGNRFTGSELVLNKPFQMSDLLGLIGRMLARSPREEPSRC